MSDHDIRDFDAHADDALRRALREHAPRPPADDVDWDGLHARITAAATPLLGRATAPAWWQMLAGWSPRGLPLAAAASVLLMIAVGTGVIAPRTTAATPTTVAFLTLEEELAAGSAAFLAASDDADAVLDALLFSDMEER